jgi:putative RNA 2'-phosphotransferase
VDDRRLSKLLALVLRHQPDRFGVVLDAAGWTDVATLLGALQRHGARVDRADLDRVVDGNDKQRFSYDGTRTRIRAAQGHSVPVDLGLAPRRPPDLLWHGTPERNLTAILAEGLRAGSRHAVHLSGDVATARRVGSRRGRAVVLQVTAGRMHVDGFTFTRSDNGVWLVPAVPPAYLSVLGGGTRP